MDAIVCEVGVEVDFCFVEELEVGAYNDTCNSLTSEQLQFAAIVFATLRDKRRRGSSLAISQATKVLTLQLLGAQIEAQILVSHGLSDEDEAGKCYGLKNAQ